MSNEESIIVLSALERFQSENKSSATAIDVARLTKFTTTHVRKVLNELSAEGRVHRQKTPGQKDSQILYARGKY